jgi:outer membrane protein assembly factor BamB
MSMWIRRALPFAAGMVVSTCIDAASLWRTPWLLEAPPREALLAQGTTRGLDGIAFTDDGDLLLGTQGFYGYQDGFVTRVAPDGTLRWNGVVHAWDPPAAIVPLADGGAYATFATPFLWGGFAARLDANGNTLWARDVPARALVPIDAERVAISDCEALSLLDAATGIVRWNRTLSPSGNCGGDGLVVDGATLYAFALPQRADQNEIPQLVAYSLDGALRWQADLPGTGTYFDTFPSLMGIGDGTLYVRTDHETIAVDAANGTILWRVPEGGVLVASVAHEPIVAAPDGLERLDASAGDSRWKAPIGSHVAPVGEVGGAIVAVSDTTLYRIDVETGETVWSVALPAVDPPGAYRYWTAIGGLAADGTFSLAGHTNFEPFVQRVDFATGALRARVPVPAIEQGIYGNSVRDGEDIVGYHFDATDVLRLIDVDAETGAVRWNSVTQLDAAGSSAYAYTGNVHVAFGTARVVAAVPLNDGPSPGVGFVEVAAWDRASGALAWDATLFDWQVGEYEADVAQPLVDSQGNVFVSAAMLEPCGDGSLCAKYSFYKLAAADGSIVWRVDDDHYGGVIANTIDALDDDVLVRGPFQDSSATLRRLSSVDGSVLWESDVFADPGLANVYRRGANLIVFPTAVGSTQWDALDAATGAIVWASTAPCDPDAYCFGSDGIVLSDGHLIVPMQPGADASLVELATDGSGATDAWPLAPAADNLYTFLFGLDEQDDGRIGFVLQRYGTSMSSAVWAGRFDRDAPQSTSFQRIPALPLGPIASDELVLDRVMFDAGPTRNEYSRDDVAITAHGDLAISVTLDGDHASPGRYVGFRFSATYTGDAPISGAELRGKLPWPSGVVDLACAGTSVSNCVVDTSIRDVVATFDIAPGGTVEVTGRVLVVDFPGGDTARIGARVVGPTALDEHETANNFARATVTLALFADGFDGD